MRSWAFWRGAAWACVLVLMLSGCGGSPDWMKSPSWFGHSVAQKNAASQTPKGPLTVPQAAPVSPVQSAQLPAPTVPPATTPAPALPSAQAQPLQPSGKIRVALLLPLSGKNAALGQAMLNAAQQAVFDIAPPNFELVPRDTGGNEEQVDMATRDAIASGTQLLIGPLFATHVPIVRAIAQASGLNMLTLSTDTSLAAPGLYVMGFAPDAQVDRVVRYAVAHGLKRIAALVPNDAYGARVGQALRATLDRVGGTLVTLDVYDPEHHDTSVGVHDLYSRREAIDALFLPEGGTELNGILGQLTAAGMDLHVMRVLGTGLWDAPDFAKQNAAAVGGWYAAPDPALRRKFIGTYAATYGQEPPRLATLAYDATALAAVLAKRGASFDQTALTNPNGFAGVDGIFRLSSQGIVERGLAVLEVGTDGSHVIDNAPTTFAAR